MLPALSIFLLFYTGRNARGNPVKISPPLRGSIVFQKSFLVRARYIVIWRVGRLQEEKNQNSELAKRFSGILAKVERYHKDAGKSLGSSNEEEVVGRLDRAARALAGSSGLYISGKLAEKQASYFDQTLVTHRSLVKQAQSHRAYSCPAETFKFYLK